MTRRTSLPFHRSGTSLGFWTPPGESSLQGAHTAPSETSFLSRPAQKFRYDSAADGQYFSFVTDDARCEGETYSTARSPRARTASNSTDFTHAFWVPFASAPSAFCGSPPSQSPPE